MEYCISIVFTMILSVCGLNISNYMFRIPAFENLVFLPTSVISTINLSSPLQCASHCTRNVECRSTMFNTDKRCCQLLSVYMDTLSDTRPHISHGWLYYEEKIGKYNFELHHHLLSSESKLNALDILNGCDKTKRLIIRLVYLVKFRYSFSTFPSTSFYRIYDI